MYISECTTFSFIFDPKLVPCYMKDTYLREQIEKIIFVRQSNPIDLNSIMIKI